MERCDKCGAFLGTAVVGLLDGDYPIMSWISSQTSSEEESKLESEIQRECRLAANGPDVVVWRNNVGVCTHDSGDRVAYGVGGTGGADLLGIVAGRFCAFEIKRPREKPRADQARFLNLVRLKGGFAAVVTSKEEMVAAIQRAREGKKQ